MSIRLRLTLWYTGLLAVILCILTVGTLSFIRRALLAEMDATIRGQADGVIALFREENDPLTVLVSGRARIPTIDVFASQVYVQIRGRDGQIVQRSSNLGELSLPGNAEAFRANLVGKAALYEAPEQDRLCPTSTTPITCLECSMIGAL